MCIKYVSEAKKDVRAPRIGLGMVVTYCVGTQNQARVLTSAESSSQPPFLIFFVLSNF